nr:prolipoprotein diacylglyceryl transferase [Glaciihabitans sp. dw_435]
MGQWFHWIGVPESTVLGIHAYAICILIGIIAAIWITSHRLTKRGAEPGIVLDIALWAVPLGIIGGRIFHVLTHPNDYFGEGKAFWHVFAIWEGGLAIFGALILGAVGVWIGCRFAGIRFWSFADALVPGLLVAQAFGRLGNYFNHELFGQPTDLPWGLEIESTNSAFPIGLPDGTLFHPTFAYEIIWNLFGVVILLLIERNLRLRWGKMLGLYLIWYGVGRSWFETIRIDPSEVFLGIRTNVWAAFAAIIIGLVILIVQTRRHPGIEPGPWVPGREWPATSSGVESEETYSDSDDSGTGATHAPETAATSGSGS